MQYVKTSVDNLYRDTESFGLVSQNVEAYNAYKAQRSKQNEIDLLNNKVEGLESEINMLKRLILEKIGS